VTGFVTQQTGKKMSTDTVPVQNETEEEVVDHQVELPAEEQESKSPSPEQPKDEHVPLSAHLKERRKRQEIEQELRWYKEQAQRQQPAQAAPEPDESLQEPVIREDLGKFKQDFKKEVKREVFEDEWKKHNPEKLAEINENLQEFLKQRPHLARAIEDAPNRFEEAWTLMDALSPKQKVALRPAVTAKKDAPGNPSGMPKAAAMNQAIDVMAMSDSEFNAWRNSQRKRR
jgi:hypothetical protein